MSQLKKKKDSSHTNMRPPVWMSADLEIKNATSSAQLPPPRVLNQGFLPWLLKGDNCILEKDYCGKV